MVKNPPNRKVLSQVAWPLETLYDTRGVFCGFIMPKLNETVTLQSFYEYPQTSYADMRTKYKVIVAQNICVVLSELHAAGYVFGDFNPANIGVNPKTGEVAFYDMDTCHFKDRYTGATYRCVGGCDGYVAPELLEKLRLENRNYKTASLPTFTVDTDGFALAIHIFKLLMNGITPYEDGYRFDRVMAHPPSLPHKDTLPAEMHWLLSKACGKNGGRPTPEEWREALLRMEKNLISCKSNKAHDYRAAFSHCPYCEADRRHQDILKQCGFSTGKTVPNPRVTQRIIPSNPTPNVAPKKKKMPKWVLYLLLLVTLLRGISWYQQEKLREELNSIYVPQPQEEVIYTEESVEEKEAKKRASRSILVIANSFSGRMGEYDEKDTFFYTSHKAGTYFFDCQISDENDNGYYLYIWTEDGELVTSQFYRGGVTADLDSMTRYYIEVYPGTVRTPFSYTVKIQLPQ